MEPGDATGEVSNPGVAERHRTALPADSGSAAMSSVVPVASGANGSPGFPWLMALRPSARPASPETKPGRHCGPHPAVALRSDCSAGRYKPINGTDECARHGACGRAAGRDRSRANAVQKNAAPAVTSSACVELRSRSRNDVKGIDHYRCRSVISENVADEMKEASEPEKRCGEGGDAPFFPAVFFGLRSSCRARDRSRPAFPVLGVRLSAGGGNAAVKFR